MGRSRKRLSDQPFELDIVTLDAKGLGMAVQGEKNLHVYDALPNEKVVARYLFGRSQRGKAETLEVLEPSADRVEARCPHFGVCGACSLQHLSLDAQLARKQSVLMHFLRDTGHVEPTMIYPPLSGPQWNYRRKARLSVRDVAAKKRVLVGFRERNGRFVADMNECHILRTEIADALPELSRLIKTLECRAAIPQIEIACGDSQSALIIRHLEELTGNDRENLRDFARESGLAIFSQPAGPDSIELLEPVDLQLEYSIESLGLRFHFDPLDFIQVNGGLNQQMVGRALELLDPQAEDTILDLFCGLGNFTLALATRAGQVTGVEGSEQMVERGRGNAHLNGQNNVGFHAADLYKPTQSPPWPLADYNKVLLDPPRSGAQDLLPWIAASKAQQVLYISCNPETLARDAGILVNQYGFSLEGAGVIDMFPHTPHSESIALFKRHTIGLT
ncbi:MAG: 23S rRNA (uracil(1939)-C(5))-methyltransferase RlmD [Gammaproteobacteria bacterium]|nr:23S rRNA (uracil(1939)-C(5))-methyltransferase RlmD [Gammaproteobacteria bacterium]